MSPINTLTQTPASISGSASHSNIELQPVGPAALRDQGRTLGGKTSSNIDPVEFLPQPSTTVSVVERWNHPDVNIYRTFATLFAFMIMGANDAAYGVSSRCAYDFECAS
jgi:hypothetical protein